MRVHIGAAVWHLDKRCRGKNGWIAWKTYYEQIGQLAAKLVLANIKIQERSTTNGWVMLTIIPTRAPINFFNYKQ